jgi:hypothetical protein
MSELELGWNETDKGEKKYPRKILSHRHFSIRIPPKTDLRVNPGLRNYRPSNIHVSNGNDILEINSNFQPLLRSFNYIYHLL